MRNTDIGCIVLAPFAPCTPIDLMMGDLSAALNQSGAVSRMILHGAEADHPIVGQVIRELHSSGMAGCIIAMNGKLRVMIAGSDGRTHNIHDALGLPLVAFLVDHPAQHGEHLRNLPDKALVTVIDARHAAFLEQAGVPPEKIIFCPHGGPDPLPDPRPAGDRSIDLLFVGNMGEVPDVNGWLDQSAGADPHQRGVLARVLEAALAGEEVFAATSREFAAAGWAHDPWSVAPVVVAIDAYVTQSRRVQVLQAIRRRRVVVLGNVAPGVAARIGHHDLRGETQFPVALRLMADAKVMINSRKSFSGGAHERIFYGLSRGAVSLTEASSFLADELGRRAGMVTLPDGAAEIDALADHLCGDMAELAAIGERGLAEYTQRHSWRDRAGRMLQGARQFLA